MKVRPQGSLGQSRDDDDDYPTPTDRENYEFLRQEHETYREAIYDDIPGVPPATRLEAVCLLRHLREVARELREIGLLLNYQSN